MKKIKILLVAALGLLATSCYNDFDMPADTTTMTDDVMKEMGMEHLTIKELKDMLWVALQTDNAPEEEVAVLFPGDDNEKPIE